jgi:hypothetical protein
MVDGLGEQRAAVSDSAVVRPSARVTPGLMIAMGFPNWLARRQKR